MKVLIFVIIENDLLISKSVKYLCQQKKFFHHIVAVFELLLKQNVKECIL